jgi:PKD repeat protein
MNLKSVLYCSALTLMAVTIPSPQLKAQTATVTADFANRANNTARIPASMFGTNLASFKNTSTVAQLTEAGITQGRRIGNISFVYATRTPNWSQLDWSMDQARAANVHPIIVLTDSPPWLQPSPTPCANRNSPQLAAPTDVSQWATIAASYVTHLDQMYPGLVADYEIWNEPELQTSFCVVGDTDAIRLRTYLSLYAAAANAMRAAARQDGVTIRIGGPTLSRMSLVPEWVGALLSNPQTAPNVDFVSFHYYPTGASEISAGMTWSSLYTRHQSLTNGLPFYYSQISALVKKGLQPNAANTPVYLTEFNTNWSFSLDCCRNSPVYAPLWNAATVADLLNSVYTGSNVPGRMYYFAGTMPPFCMFGAWNSAMDCNASSMEPYPQYYAYQLLASSSYLGLEEGGRMAASVSPATTQSGLMATAFYTAKSDAIVIINPTGTSYSQVTAVAKNSGYGTVQGSLHLLDSAHGQINTRSLVLSNGSAGATATFDVPAYSVVALAITGSTPSASPNAVLSVTPQSGPAPLQVSADSSASSAAGSGSIVSRSISFGDGATSNAVAATHSYTSAGTFLVKLTLTDSGGLTSSTTKTVTVSAPLAAAPKAVLTLVPALGTAPLQISADSSLSSGTITSRIISFGDGVTVAASTKTAHIYNAPGTYTVKLTVTNSSGGTSQATQIARVESLQNSGFESGAAGWAFRSAADGSAQTLVTSAHSGSRYIELKASAATHPEIFAVDAMDNAVYFPVTAGQTITFGGWAYGVSGNGMGRWSIELTDASKQQPIYVTALPAQATQGVWTHQQRSFVVPTGKAFVRFYAEVYQSTTATTVRFDDASLQIH